MTTRHRIACVLATIAVLAPLAALGDSVHLKNGESFEGVEAVVTGDTVRIELTWNCTWDEEHGVKVCIEGQEIVDEE